MSPAAAAGVAAVRGYQWFVRPLIGANCRFLPTCSDYAIGALCTHGALRGGVLAGKRILRCNPWHEGGYDPVPPAAQATAAQAPAAQAPAAQATTHEDPSGPAPHGSARP